MRAIWKGTISFGLVSVGVKVFSATEEKDIRFHQVHQADGGRIRYKRVCADCGDEVAYADIAKGYDVDGGAPVVLTNEDFADLPLATSRVIDVLEFVPAEQIDPILYDRVYFLTPAEKANSKAYVLLRDALEESGRVAVVKVALRQREHLATLRVRDGLLLLNTMLWPDEVRKPEFQILNESPDIRPAELAMAGALIESMVGEFDPDAFTDDYRAAVQEVVDAKVEGREVVQPAAIEQAPAVDLIAALTASVQAAQARRDSEPIPITAARSARGATKTRRSA
ncbi:Ku protein [Micromonospora sp. WMMD736]|uniref:non-homologous end joining protein Ku n=1 Tax=Micromonospora sp. WMMD736 TaxID=3404112 RepID=UPI003B947063